MSFTSTIDVTRALKTRAFDVPNNGTVMVTCDGHMDRPGGCPFLSYSVEVVREGILSDSGRGARAYPIGARHAEAWRNLPAGRYYLLVSIDNSNPNCHLVGNITVAT